MPANGVPDHIREIIFVRSCKDRFTFVLNEKYPSRFVPIGSSHLTQMPPKRSTGKAHLTHLPQ